MMVRTPPGRGRLSFPPGLRLIFLLLPFLALAWLTPAGEGESLPDLEVYPWSYLRRDQPVEPGERLVSVLAVGDVMLGRGVSVEPDPWGDAAGWLGASDLTLGNLEGVLVNGGTPRWASSGHDQPILLSAPPAAARSLPQAGFDVIGLANNHALDFGVAGLKETITHLRRAGLEIIGTTLENGTVKPLYYEVDGVRLAFLAFNAAPDPHPTQICPAGITCWPQPSRWDAAVTVPAIASAKAQADAVIVSMHWGFEYEPRPDPGQEKVASIMLEAGADLIVGHHPHVVQAIAVHGDQVIAYSLGNFVFDQGADETRQGLALQAFFDQEGLRAVQALPVRSGTRPRLLTLSEGASLLAQVLPPPRRVGFTCDQSGCTPARVPQTGHSGLFYGDQVDLTGDGLAEIVRREGQRITIYENGSAVWHSPAAWQVVDADLGDPNDDGRYEVMLAIWQKDASGHERSQPYILGHRGGEYALLWGGRPVVDPIRELEVGDVDGDGSDELVVIDERAGGSAQAVSVWRWAGWTFSLLWRSEYGRYHDLVLVDGDKPLISAGKALD